MARRIPKQAGREPQDGMWQLMKQQYQAQQAGISQAPRPEPLSVMARRLGILRPFLRPAARAR
jgi:hypothetical protein